MSLADVLSLVAIAGILVGLGWLIWQWFPDHEFVPVYRGLRRAGVPRIFAMPLVSILILASSC